MKKVALSIVLVLFITTLSFNQENVVLANDQNPDEKAFNSLGVSGEYVLALYSKNTSKKVIFKKDQKIKIWYSENNKEKGLIDSISKNSIFISELEIEIITINKISYHKSKKLTSGVVSMLFGGILSAVGLLIYIDSGQISFWSTENYGQKHLGAGGIALGAGLLTTGILLTSIPKKILIQNDWEIKAEIHIE